MHPRERDFVFESVILKRYGSAREIDITFNVLEANIYEALGQMYVSGRILLADTTGLFHDRHVEGNEEIIFTIGTRISDIKIVKSLRVTRVEKKVDVGAVHNAYLLYLTDEKFLVNAVTKISKAYTGTPSSIIARVAYDYFGIENFEGTGSPPKENSITYIAPNISPFQVIEAMRKKMVSPEGFPYKIAATLENDGLKAFDVHEIHKPRSTSGIFYYGTHISAPFEELEELRYRLESFKAIGSFDTISHILNGAISGDLTALNLITGEKTQNSEYFLPDTLEAIELQGRYQNIFTGMNINGRDIRQYKPHDVYKITTGHTHKDLRYADEPSIEDHKKYMLARGIDLALEKFRVEVSTGGVGLLKYAYERMGGIHLLGTPISIQKFGTTENPIDTSLSGQYAISAINHSFVENRYTAHLELTKLYNEPGSAFSNLV